MPKERFPVEAGIGLVLMIVAWIAILKTLLTLLT